MPCQHELARDPTKHVKYLSIDNMEPAVHTLVPLNRSQVLLSSIELLHSVELSTLFHNLDRPYL